ncbi:CCP1 [Bugula neritina]|nr:CCP1 [Bugula neritina]
MFHDCVGGEIDGCIQLTNPSNKGNPAVTAIVKDKLKYQFGRKDTTGTCPSRTFPDFTLNPTGYLRKKKNFANLTHSQAVALLGCHSTGRAHVESSGYRHSWVVDNTALTNDYYQLLSNTSLDWHVAYVTHDGVTKVQWELNTGTKTIMLLHQDASLWYKIKLGNGGVPTCGYPGSPSSSDFPRLPECAPSAEREFVKAFRDDLLLWIRELCDGIMIMTTVAESNLIDPFD